jgi:hypothetical protein
MLELARRVVRSGRAPLIMAALLLSLAACETPHGSVAGGGSDNGGAGRIKIGWPF